MISNLSRPLGLVPGMSARVKYEVVWGTTKRKCVISVAFPVYVWFVGRLASVLNQLWAGVFVTSANWVSSVMFIEHKLNGTPANLGIVPVLQLLCTKTNSALKSSSLLYFKTLGEGPTTSYFIQRSKIVWGMGHSAWLWAIVVTLMWLRLYGQRCSSRGRVR